MAGSGLFITHSSTLELEIPHRSEDKEKIGRVRRGIVFLPKMSLNLANKEAYTCFSAVVLWIYPSSCY
jgi:hypothetical protein